MRRSRFGVAPARGRQLGRVRVDGRSMLPTLRPGDRLLVRWGAPVTAGRCVVVRLPLRGTPDGASFSGSGGASADAPGDAPGEASKSGVLSVKRAWRRTAAGWWVERDNPTEGVDSWRVGAVPEADVLGVVWMRYWPPDDRLGRSALAALAAVAGWARRRAR